MAIKCEGYRERIIDETVERYLKVFGAVCIEGPKWCGKTWTSLNHANSVIYIASSENNFQNRTLAEIEPDAVLKGEEPRLVDEWQEVPLLWDAVRFNVDKGARKGMFILTGSSTPIRKGVLHSGTGRIAKLRMRPMSLFESGESSGVISLKELFNGVIDAKMGQGLSLEGLARLVIRGGWPGSTQLEQDISLVPKAYIKSLLEEDVYKLDETKYDSQKMERLLKALARNNATIVSKTTLRNDIDEDSKIDIDTISNYLSVFKRLFVIEEIPPFSPNIRSSVRVGRTVKRIFVDSSLACGLIGASEDKLIGDLHTFGFMFENLVLRDLLIYAESIGARVYHYRDDKNREVDAIIELEDGRYGAFEIKLGANGVDNGAASLLRFKEALDDDKLVVLVVITGLGNAAYKRDDGVIVVPINQLRN